MLKIGVNTFLVASPFTTDSIAVLEQFKAWGIDGVEIALEDTSHVDGKKLRPVLDDLELPCLSICAAMGPGRDLRGTDEEQQNALDYINGTMEIMADLGCPVLVGPLYSVVGRAESTPKDVYKKQFDTVAGHLKTLAQRADSLGVKLAIEPLNRYETDFVNTSAQAVALVEAVDHAAVGILLDTYHMNIEEKNQAEAIAIAGKHLLHVHACGCDRGAPGGDHLDWDGISGALKAIGYSGSLVIESFTPDVKVVAKAASIWRDVEPSQESIAVKGLSFLRSKFTDFG